MEIGKITKNILGKVFHEITYPIIKNVAGSVKSSMIDEGEYLNLKASRDATIGTLFNNLMALQDYSIQIIIGDVGIEAFLSEWVEYIKIHHDSIRQGATGELENLNLKMNLVLNKITEENSEEQ